MPQERLVDNEMHRLQMEYAAYHKLQKIKFWGIVCYCKILLCSMMWQWSIYSLGEIPVYFLNTREK